MYRRCSAGIKISKICLRNVNISILLLECAAYLRWCWLIVFAESFIISRDLIIPWHNRRRLLLFRDTECEVRFGWCQLSLLLNDFTIIYGKNLTFLDRITDVFRRLCVLLPFWTQWLLLQVVIILNKYLAYRRSLLGYLLKNYIWCL
jgi:hypothetical protein